MNKPQLNLQDVFLNQVRKENISVTIYLIGGVQLRVNARDDEPDRLDCGREPRLLGPFCLDFLGQPGCAGASGAQLFGDRLQPIAFGLQLLAKAIHGPLELRDFDFGLRTRPLRGRFHLGGRGSDEFLYQVGDAIARIAGMSRW